MSLLLETLEAVKDERLSKSQLENYHMKLSNLLSDIKLQIGTLKKQRALFIAKKSSEESIASKKSEWESTIEGQRLLELESYDSAARIQLSSLKSRLYIII